MPWTQANIDAQKAAIADAKGAKLIQHGDQRTDLRDLDELERILAMMERDVAGTSYQSRRFASVSKGTPT